MALPDQVATEDEFTTVFMEIHLGPNLTADQCFTGALPEVGEAVEMIYVGSRPNGSMQFKLCTRGKAYDPA